MRWERGYSRVDWGRDGYRLRLHLRLEERGGTIGSRVENAADGRRLGIGGVGVPRVIGREGRTLGKKTLRKGEILMFDAHEEQASRACIIVSWVTHSATWGFGGCRSEMVVSSHPAIDGLSAAGT